MQPVKERVSQNEGAKVNLNLTSQSIFEKKCDFFSILPIFNMLRFLTPA